MARSKSGGGKNTTNLLRLSGMIFLGIGLFHVLRYFKEWEFRVAGFELTYLGSLILGGLLLLLSAGCFLNSRN